MKWLNEFLGDVWCFQETIFRILFLVIRYREEVLRDWQAEDPDYVAGALIMASIALTELVLVGICVWWLCFKVSSHV